jgi:hypothetical protein
VSRLGFLTFLRFSEDWVGGWWVAVSWVVRVLNGIGVLGGGRRWWLAGWLDGREVGLIQLDDG